MFQKIFLFFVLSGFLLAGCGGGSADTSSSSGGAVTDEEAITSEVNNSQLFGSDLTDDNGALYTASGAEAQVLQEGAFANVTGTCQPVAWGRGNLRRQSRNINISINAGVASVDVTDRITGILYVDATDDGTINPWQKPFDDTVSIHAEFVKEHSGWRLNKISPVDVSLTDAAQQTVQITRVSAYVNGLAVWEATSPTQLFDVPDGLPTFLPQTNVLVEAAVSNTTVSGCTPPTYVYLHRPGIFGKVRDIMYDDGTNGDLQANDGVFSRVYTIGSVLGYHFAAVDVMDADTFTDSTTPYNSTAWGMPYRVSN